MAEAVTPVAKPHACEGESAEKAAAPRERGPRKLRRAECDDEPAEPARKLRRAGSRSEEEPAPEAPARKRKLARAASGSDSESPKQAASARKGRRRAPSQNTFALEARALLGQGSQDSPKPAAQGSQDSPKPAAKAGGWVGTSDSEDELVAKAPASALEGPAAAKAETTAPQAAADSDEEQLVPTAEAAAENPEGAGAVPAKKCIGSDDESGGAKPRNRLSALSKKLEARKRPQRQASSQSLAAIASDDESDDAGPRRRKGGGGRGPGRPRGGGGGGASKKPQWAFSDEECAEYLKELQDRAEDPSDRRTAFVFPSQPRAGLPPESYVDAQGKLPLYVKGKISVHFLLSLNYLASKKDKQTGETTDQLSVMTKKKLAWFCEWATDYQLVSKADVSRGEMQQKRREKIDSMHKRGVLELDKCLVNGQVEKCLDFGLEDAQNEKLLDKIKDKALESGVLTAQEKLSQEDMFSKLSTTRDQKKKSISMLRATKYNDDEIARQLAAPKLSYTFGEEVPEDDPDDLGESQLIIEFDSLPASQPEPGSQTGSNQTQLMKQSKTSGRDILDDFLKRAQHKNKGKEKLKELKERKQRREDLVAAIVGLMEKKGAEVSQPQVERLLRGDRQQLLLFKEDPSDCLQRARKRLRGEYETQDSQSLSMSLGTLGPLSQDPVNWDASSRGAETPRLVLSQDVPLAQSQPSLPSLAQSQPREWDDEARLQAPTPRAPTDFPDDFALTQAQPTPQAWAPEPPAHAQPEATADLTQTQAQPRGPALTQTQVQPRVLELTQTQPQPRGHELTQTQAQPRSLDACLEKFTTFELAQTQAQPAPAAEEDDVDDLLDALPLGVSVELPSTPAAPAAALPLGVSVELPSTPAAPAALPLGVSMEAADTGAADAADVGRTAAPVPEAADAVEPTQRKPAKQGELKQLFKQCVERQVLNDVLPTKRSRVNVESDSEPEPAPVAVSDSEPEPSGLTLAQLEQRAEKLTKRARAIARRRQFQEFEAEVSDDAIVTGDEREDEDEADLSDVVADAVELDDRRTKERVYRSHRQWAMAEDKKLEQAILDKKFLSAKARPERDPLALLEGEGGAGLTRKERLALKADEGDDEAEREDEEESESDEEPEEADEGGEGQIRRRGARRARQQTTQLCNPAQRLAAEQALAVEISDSDSDAGAAAPRVLAARDVRRAGHGALAKAPTKGLFSAAEDKPVVAKPAAAGVALGRRGGAKPAISPAKQLVSPAKASPPPKAQSPQGAFAQLFHTLKDRKQAQAQRR